MYNVKAFIQCICNMFTIYYLVFYGIKTVFVYNPSKDFFAGCRDICFILFSSDNCTKSCTRIISINMKNFLKKWNSLAWSQLTMTWGAVVSTVTVAMQVKAVKNIKQILSSTWKYFITEGKNSKRYPVLTDPYHGGKPPVFQDSVTIFITTNFLRYNLVDKIL